MPEAAFAAREAQKAKKYATTLLESARQAPKDPAYRDVIHNANVILGWVALKEGKIDQAKRHLREAGKLPRSFGPNIELALELLKKGITGNGAPKAAPIVFTSSGDYPVGDFPLALVAGDLDGDGDSDLVAVNRNSGSLSVLLNRGDGSFADAVSYTVGGQPTSVTGGDFDGDGDLDLALANSRSSDISVLLNKGDGTFLPRTNIMISVVNVRHLIAEDLDGDGDLDLIGGGGVGTAALCLALNNGDGTFVLAKSLAFSALPMPTSITGGDFDRDGDVDLALGGSLSRRTIAILMNNGDGTFIEAQKLVLDIHWFVTSGDFDGDGDLDLAVAFGIRPGQVLILLNDGKGRFERAGAFPSGKQPFHIATGDLDLDGDLDMAVANMGIRSSGADVAVLLNNGDATFEKLGNFPVRSAPRAVIAADLDGDGDLDLATANPGTDTVSVLLNSRVP